jgi:hypothetical protein
MHGCNEETIEQRACREIVTGLVRFLAITDEPVVPDSPYLDMAARCLGTLVEDDSGELFEDGAGIFLRCLSGATEAAAAHGGRELREHYYGYMRHRFSALEKLYHSGELAALRLKASELMARHLGASA